MVDEGGGRAISPLAWLSDDAVRVLDSSELPRRSCHTDERRVESGHVCEQSIGRVTGWIDRDENDANPGGDPSELGSSARQLPENRRTDVRAERIAEAQCNDLSAQPAEAELVAAGG